MKTRLISLTLALVLATPAFAGDSTVTASPGSGGPVFHTKTDGSSNNFGFTSIGDGAAGAYSLTIKNASTAPAAGDFAAVVGLSPNSIGGTVGNGMFVNPATGATFPVSGTVAISGSVAVTGTFWQATQPVSLSSLPTLAAGTNLVGKVGIDQTTVGTTNGISLAQVGANTVSTGAGVTGTGTQRVGVAQDATTVAGSAPGTAGTPSTNVVSVQGVAGGTAVPVSGTLTATGFTPSGNYANIASVTTTSSNVALPTGSPTTIVVYNTGSYPIAVKLGTSNAVTVTATTGDVIQPGASTPFVVGSNAYLAALSLTSAQTSSVTISGGSGLATPSAPGTNTVANTNGNGQATMSASSPVVIASDQSAINVKGGAANGAALSGNPVLIAGGNGTNAYTLKTDTSGQVYVQGAGTAGSAAGGVVSVQGVASMTPLNDNLSQVGGTAATSLMVATSTAPVTATNQALVVDLRPDSPGIVALGGATTANSMSTIPNSQYPANSVTTAPTPLVAKATGTTAAVTATITPAATATAYICGFDVSYIGGTAAVGPITVTGLLGGTWTYQLPVSSATNGNTFSKEFNMCVPASAVNTAISVVTTADGTATAVDVQLHGYGL